MGLLNTLAIGHSGLKVAAYGIDTTGSNVANAQSEGYVRRTLTAETRFPHRQADGTFLGQGATTASVRRSIDRFITERHMDSTGRESEARTGHENLQVLEASFREGDVAGISDRFDAFFDALTELTLEPGDSGLRTGAIEAGKDIASAINSGAAAVDDNIRRIETRLEDEIEGINDLLVEIGALNRQISDSDAVTGPADLLDKRDSALRDLIEKVGGSVEYKTNGQINLYVGGHALVQDVHVRELSLTGTSGSLDVQMSLDGAVITITDILGGELGGLVSARTVSQDTGTDLDTLAQDFADAFNLQHSLGYDRTGASGGDFFTYGATNPASSLKVDSALADDSDLIAAAGAPTADVGDGDNLSALIDIEDVLLFDGATKNSREFISSIYANLGIQIRSFAVTLETEVAALSDLDALHTALTGVDLDEEAVKLIQYQASYQAAARIVTTADKMLETLMRM
jgi:flagellar hook-associated protein 1 FlgK